MFIKNTRNDMDMMCCYIHRERIVDEGGLIAVLTGNLDVKDVEQIIRHLRKEFKKHGMDGGCDFGLNGQAPKELENDIKDVQLYVDIKFYDFGMYEIITDWEWMLKDECRPLSKNVAKRYFKV